MNQARDYVILNEVKNLIVQSIPVPRECTSPICEAYKSHTSYPVHVL